MTVTIKFFASIREQVGVGEKTLDNVEGQSVAEIWHSVTGSPINTSVLSAVNKEYVNAETIVNNGDELAFFPPVTGG